MARNGPESVEVVRGKGPGSRCIWEVEATGCPDGLVTEGQDSRVTSTLTA